jgi:sugar lactone lactonase YvrE
VWAGRSLIVVLACGIAPYGYGQELFKAFDLTAENLFSENIEGPCPDGQGGIYLVNFEKDGTLGHLSADGKAELFVRLPTPSNGNAIQMRSGKLLVADWVGHNILRVDMSSQEVSVYCHDDRFNQPNDICINKRGQLFASDPAWKNGTGQLWRIDPNRKAVLLKSGMGTTNGIELSPDEKTLYVNESVQRRVWSFPLDRKGTIGAPVLFHEFPDFGMDGMKCDREGNLYVTRHGKGTVAILSPSGELIREVEMKGKKTSNLAFGGKDGTLVFVTLQDRKCVEAFYTNIPGKGF